MYFFSNKTNYLQVYTVSLASVYIIIHFFSNCRNPKSTCEIKINEIKTENDILTKNFDINLHVTNDHNSPMINNIKKLHKATNDNNHNSNAFLDDFVKKEQLWLKSPWYE